MRITHLGHAGLEVETGHARLLIDPWLSPEGAFLASWFQYPENSHLLTRDLLSPTAVVISHEHLDHVDPWFLSQVDADVPVVIPRCPSPILRRKVRSAGRREIVELDPWASLQVAPGTTVWFVPEETPMYHDSAIVVTGDGHTLLDLNDARLSPAQFGEIRVRAGGTIDFFSFQAAGASWHPFRYSYADEDRRALALRKRQAKLKYAERAMQAVQPVAGLPFAGPPCFLDPELFWHNTDIPERLVADQGQVVESMRERGLDNLLLLMPGDAWDTASRQKEADPRWEGFSPTDCLPYLESYAERRRPAVESVLARYPEPSEPLWEPFREYFGRLLEMSPYFTARIGMRVGFRILGPAGGCWAVDFRPESQGVFAVEGDCAFKFAFDSRWLGHLLRGELRWEDFLLSRRFTAWRHPDLYNNHLFGLLKFAHPEALGAVERYERALAPDDSFTIQSEEGAFRVQRYCPHAGNDLLMTGEVLPGDVLRCNAHRYEFELDGGRCINGACAALVSTRLPERSVERSST